LTGGVNLFRTGKEKTFKHKSKKFFLQQKLHRFLLNRVRFKVNPTKKRKEKIIDRQDPNDYMCLTTCEIVFIPIKFINTFVGTIKSGQEGHLPTITLPHWDRLAAVSAWGQWL